MRYWPTVYTEALKLWLQIPQTDQRVLPPGEYVETCIFVPWATSHHLTAVQRQTANKRERHRGSQFYESSELKIENPVQDFQRKPSSFKSLKLATYFIQCIYKLEQSFVVN